MKPLFLVSVAAIVLLTAPAPTPAQTGPDFSGRWKISQAKSTRGAVGNGARVTFPSEMIIKQHPAELHIESSLPRTPSVTTVYKLDGSEVTVTMAEGITGVTEMAKATREGATLVIAARRVVSTPIGDLVTDSKEVWSRNGNVLSIARTQTSFGLSENETAVYEKDQS